MKDIEICVANNMNDLLSAFSVRERIFVGEQGFDKRNVFDGNDDVAVNYVLKLDGCVVAVGRCKDYDEESVIIDSFGVDKHYRHKGFARQLLSYMLKDIENSYGESKKYVVLSAQTYVKSLYQEMGFVEEGNAFYRVGIEHIFMRRPLSR